MHALHSTPQQKKVALQWMMMMVMVTKKLKRLPANGAVGAKRCRGKRAVGLGPPRGARQEWGVAVVMVVMMVGGDYEKH